jgi:hypothetical protein
MKFVLCGPLMSRGSVVGIATGYELDDGGFRALLSRGQSGIAVR